MRVWSDPIRCVTYVESVEIKGLCFEEEPDLDDVVAAISSFFGVPKALARTVLLRAVRRLPQLSVSVDELIYIINEVGRSPHNRNGVSSGEEKEVEALAQ